MGAIIAIVMLSSRSLAPAGQIAFLLTRAKQARETLESIERLFAVPDERKQGLTSLPASVRNATLKLEDCTFAYPDAPVPALDRLNLTFKPGERICLIGQIGSAHFCTPVSYPHFFFLLLLFFFFFLSFLLFFLF